MFSVALKGGQKKIIRKKELNNFLRILKHSMEVFLHNSFVKNLEE